MIFKPLTQQPVNKLSVIQPKIYIFSFIYEANSCHCGFFFLQFFSYFQCNESPKLSIQYLMVLQSVPNPEFVVQTLEIFATHYWLRNLLHRWITKPIYQQPSASKKKYHLFLSKYNDQLLCYQFNRLYNDIERKRKRQYRCFN